MSDLSSPDESERPIMTNAASDTDPYAIEGHRLGTALLIAELRGDKLGAVLLLDEHEPSVARSALMFVAALLDSQMRIAAAGSGMPLDVLVQQLGRKLLELG